jgi:1,4-dihydroxy-6-naphthoate synthase
VIASRRKFPAALSRRISDLIRDSILYARVHPNAGKEYIRCHAQEMDETVTQSHIDLYVNDYSVDLGEEGKRGINVLLQKGREQNLIKEVKQKIFL